MKLSKMIAAGIKKRQGTVKSRPSKGTGLRRAVQRARTRRRVPSNGSRIAKMLSAGIAKKFMRRRK